MRLDVLYIISRQSLSRRIEMSGRLHASSVLTREGSRLQPLNGWLGGLLRWSRRQELSSNFTAFQRVLDTFLGRDSVVGRLATSWTVRGSNPGGVRFSAPVHTSTGVNPVSYTMGTDSFPGVKRPGLGVDHLPRLAPRLKKEQSYTSTPPLGLCGLF